MFTDQFWNFRSDKFPVTSLYINRTDNPSSVGPRLGELLRDLRNNADGLDHAAAMSLREDLEAIAGLKDRIELEHAPAVAVFACSGEGFLEYMPLGDKARDVSVIGKRPYFRPLRAARNSARSAVAVVDKRTSSIFMMNGYGTTLETTITEDENVKHNYGGWQGYAERRARSHADQQAHRHYQETADALFSLHKEKAIDHIIVGGHAQHIDEFVETLHPYLRHVYAGSFVVDPHTMTTAIVTDLAMPIEDASRDNTEHRVVEELLDAAGAGARTALGLADSIKAANVRAIDKLIVSGPYVVEGTVCDACGWISRSSEPCAACGESVRAVPDVVAEVIEAVLSGGGTVVQVSVASRLDSHGLGAMLRFPIPDSL